MPPTRSYWRNAGNSLRSIRSCARLRRWRMLAVIALSSTNSSTSAVLRSVSSRSAVGVACRVSRFVSGLELADEVAVFVGHVPAWSAFGDRFGDGGSAGGRAQWCPGEEAVGCRPDRGAFVLPVAGPSGHQCSISGDRGGRDRSWSSTIACTAAAWAPVRSRRGWGARGSAAWAFRVASRAEVVDVAVGVAQVPGGDRTPGRRGLPSDPPPRRGHCR